MDARARLDAANAAMRDGRHAEALEEFVWFHEHALDESPAWSGVRLSFALRAWIDLAVFYPPAMVALRAIRDRTVAALLHGDGGKRAFRNVVSIDDYLKQQQQTYQLFLALEQHDAARAQACGHAARNAMISVGDFTRAAALGLRLQLCGRHSPGARHGTWKRAACTRGRTGAACRDNTRQSVGAARRPGGYVKTSESA